MSVGAAAWWRRRWALVEAASAEARARRPLSPDEAWAQAESLMAEAPSWPPKRTKAELAEIERVRRLWAKAERKARRAATR